MEYAFILLFLYASYLSIEKYVHTGSILKWRGNRRSASSFPIKEKPAEAQEEASEEAVIGRSRYRLWQEGVSKCTPSVFYAQSPDFHKLGLCYYLKILYL